MHMRVAVAVRHIEIAVARVKRHMRGRAERLAAHRLSGYARPPDGVQQLAVGRELPNRMIAVVHAPNRAVGRYRYAVRIGEYPVSPSANNLALRIEHHHRMRAAIEHIHAVIGAHIHRRRLSIHSAFGQTAPVIARYLIPVFARTQQDHIAFLRRISYPPQSATPSSPNDGNSNRRQLQERHYGVISTCRRGIIELKLPHLAWQADLSLLRMSPPIPPGNRSYYPEAIKRQAIAMYSKDFEMGDRNEATFLRLLERPPDAAPYRLDAYGDVRLAACEQERWIAFGTARQVEQVDEAREELLQA